MSFLRHGEIYRSDVVLGSDRPEGGAPPPVGRRPCPGKRRDGRNAPWLIVRDEFPVGYSSIGLLSSRARLRFTNWRSFCYE